MIVRLRFDFDDDYLEALGNHYGKRRATRENVVSHIIALVDGDAADLMFDLENSPDDRF